jgi:RNA polymerase sigma-70 factor (ECF subfamily)
VPFGGRDVPDSFDAAWHGEALAGDARALTALASAALKPLYRFCYYRLGRRRELCEEVVQETLVRAIRELDRYEPDRSRGNIFPWLTGLARNEIHRLLARERAGQSLEACWLRIDAELAAVYAQLESQPMPDEVLQRQETREMVNATMSQLPYHYREALEAKYVRGLSVRDIAAALSTSEKSVESQLTRAREAFRKAFLALVGNWELGPT